MKNTLLFFIIFTIINFAGPKNVLVEMLTNSHCPLCPPAHSTYKQYVQNSSSADRVNFIFYHVRLPYPSDPLYQANTSDPTARNSFYGNQSSAPVSFFDGTQQNNAYSEYGSRIDALLQEDSPFEINLSGTKNGNDFSINAEVTMTGDIAASDLAIHFVTTEAVDYQGNNGVSPQLYVMRKMIGSPDGDALSISLNETKNISKNISVQNDWIADSLTVVVFIQSSGGKKVYQSASIDYKDLTVTSIKNNGKIPSDFSLEQNYPNPFNPSTSIKFQTSQAGFVSLKVYNILGNEVATLINEVKSPGVYEVRFDASSIGGGLSSGIYIYKLIANNFSSAKKMILQK